MRVRQYEKEDYEKVKELVSQCDQILEEEKEELGGHGIVIEEYDGRITGFVWALVSERSTTGFIGYFAVSPDKRSNHTYGPLLMTKMFIDLLGAGKKKIIGCLYDEAKYADSLCRIYNEVGMKVTSGKIVSGNTVVIFEGINKRYLI